MKFKLSNLIWITTLVAVLLSSWIYVRSERTKNANLIAKAKSEAELLCKNMREFAEVESGKAYYLRDQLGLFNDAESKSATPYVRFIRLPEELGGMQLHGLPFTWRWRILLPDPDEFELCFCLDGIPKEAGDFEIASEHVYRSHLNLFNQSGNAHAGTMSMSDDESTIESLKGAAVEVALYFRIDGDSSGGKISVNFEIQRATNSFRPPKTYRGQHFNLTAEQVQWLMHHASTCAGGSSVGGFGIEHGNQIPLLDQAISLDTPTTLLKLRAQKKVGEWKFEPYENESKGLFVWVQRKKQLSSEH